MAHDFSRSVWSPLVFNRVGSWPVTSWCGFIGFLTGSMLPLIMKRLGADPASSSAPFVATLSTLLG